MGLVGGIDGQFPGEFALDVYMMKHTLLAVFAHFFPFVLMREPFAVEHVRHCFYSFGEHVQVDVRALTNMSGKHAADESRTKRH